MEGWIRIMQHIITALLLVATALWQLTWPAGISHMSSRCRSAAAPDVSVEHGQERNRQEGKGAACCSLEATWAAAVDTNIL